MSGLEVIGGLSAVIGIIDASIKIYNSARKDLKLSETFQTVGHRLPIILDTLQTCKNHLGPVQDTISPDVCAALEKILDACDEKAGKLRDIFEKVITSESEAWEKRYVKVFRRLGKGNKVEELMISITEDVQLIVNNHAVRSATPEQNTELGDIIKEMKSVKSSVSEEESSGMTINIGGRAQNTNVYTGSGQQIDNKYATVRTQNFNSVIVRQKEDFIFRKPVGLCLGQTSYIDSTLFIGRESTMDEMTEILKPGDMSRKQRLLVLGGMGGIGKTQLAIAYAIRYGDDYKSVLWLNAASEVTLKNSLRSIAEGIFDIQDPGVLESDQIRISIYRWLSNQANTEWLLIFDNYDDPGQYDIKSYYPLTLHGAIIVTTRRPDLVAGIEVRVQPFKDVKESLSILETRSHRKDARTDPCAKDLAVRLGGLPLALATAGAFLRTSNFTFKRYLQEYEDRWNIDPRRPLQLSDYQDRTLYSTWDISYTLLKREDPIAAKLLKLLAYFDNQSIWYKLLHSGVTDNSPEWLHEILADDINFSGAMRTLTEYCFVEVQKGTESWSMHNCVHDWTLAVLNKVIDAQQYWYAFDCVAASINEDDLDSLEYLTYARLAVHATRLVQDCLWRNDVIGDILPERRDGAAKIAELLASQVQLKAAEQYYLLVLARDEKALGPEHTSTLWTVNNLGGLYRAEGKLALAEQYYQRALAGYEKAQGPEHTSTLGTVHNLGTLYMDQSKLALAEQYLERALARKEKTLGPEHTSTLNTVNNLGILYRKQDKLALAEQYLQRALAGHAKAQGPEHTSTLGTVHSLGILCIDQGKLALAEQNFQRALAGREKAMGPQHMLTLQTVHNLGILYMDQGKLALAEQYYLRALAGYEKAQGPEHESTLNTLNNLGYLYKNQGKLALAEQYYQRVLVGKEKALGPEHTSTLYIVNNLGSLYEDRGELALAEQYYQRALVGKEKALGPEHTSTLNTVNNLGGLYRDLGKLALAEQYLQRALAGYEKALGLEHTSTLDTVNSLGILYVDQSKLALAEQCYQRALVGKEKALGPEHTSTLNTVNNLGNLYRTLGKLALAEQYLQRALTWYEKALGPEHTSTLGTVQNLGSLYGDEGKLALAEQCFQRALAGYEKVSQCETIPGLHIVANFGRLYRIQGQKEKAEDMFRRALLGMGRVFGPDHPNTLALVDELNNLQHGLEGNEDEARDVSSRHNRSRKNRLKKLLRLGGSRTGRS